MILFLTTLEILFAVAAAALIVRSAWLLFRGDYRHGFIHMSLAVLSFLIAMGFLFAKDYFQPGA